MKLVQFSKEIVGKKTVLNKEKNRSSDYDTVDLKLSFYQRLHLFIVTAVDQTRAQTKRTRFKVLY